MSAAPNSEPQDVVTWRLQQLEKSNEQLGARMEAANKELSTKIDSLSLLVTKNLCPSPGSCVELLRALGELKDLALGHEQAIQDFRIKEAKAMATMRTVAAIAGGGGSVVGAIAALIVQLLTK